MDGGIFMNWKERIKRWLDHEGLDEDTKKSLDLLQ